jgi:hypothetical protein
MPSSSAPAQQPAPAGSCAKCGAPLDDRQDWCLKCGAGAPDSLRTRTPTWRSAAVILTTLALLVLGAVGAAYAALGKGNSKPAVTTVAQVPAPVTPTPRTPATTLPPATPTTPAKIGVPTTIKPATPPKIPLASPTPTPTPSVPAVTPTGSGGSTPTISIPKATNPSTPVGEAHPEALLLDTNAAATYNPYNYSAANFGDPSLAIDGDSSTGWTALVEPTVAPKMAEGLVIDLNEPRRLSAAGLSTTTPGMTVQIYGANGEAPPTSITDPAWVALTPAIVAKKKHARIKFGGSTSAGQAAAKKAYRFIVLWISQAPDAAVGTPTAPGHVSVNELELFKRKK